MGSRGAAAGALAAAVLLSALGCGGYASAAAAKNGATRTNRAASRTWLPGGDYPWSGKPFAFGFGALGGAQGVEWGQRLSLQVLVAQPRGPAEAASLLGAVSLSVTIRAAKPTLLHGARRWIEAGPAVWRVALPPLRSVRAGWGAEITVPWDQRSSSGRRVSPGVYVAHLLVPARLSYRLDGRNGTEVVPGTPATHRQQHYRELIIVGVRRASYARDPLVRALATNMGIPIYVPDYVPGHPEVQQAAIFAAPPTPGITDDQALNADVQFLAPWELDEVLVTRPVPFFSTGYPQERTVTISPSRRRLTALVYRSSTGTALEGSKYVTTTSYELDVDVGHLFVELGGDRVSENQLVEMARSLVPVYPAILQDGD